MKGDTQFTRTKHLNDLYFLKCAISTHSFLKSEWIHSRKTTIRRKVPSFPTFVVCHHKRQHFELLVAEIKCRYSTADLCAQVYANMIHSNIDSFRFEEIVLAIFVSHLDWLSADYINNGQKMKKLHLSQKVFCGLQSAVCSLQSAFSPERP